MFETLTVFFFFIFKFYLVAFSIFKTKKDKAKQNKMQKNIRDRVLEKLNNSDQHCCIVSSYMYSRFICVSQKINNAIKPFKNYDMNTNRLLVSLTKHVMTPVSMAHDDANPFRSR